MKNTLLPDTQNTKDLRNIVINQVGIKDILHPINFVNRDNESHPSVANFTMTVRLPENVKGTHMSRFIEILNDNECSFGIDNFMGLVKTVADKLDSNDAQIIVDFPFFLRVHLVCIIKFWRCPGSVCDLLGVRVGGRARKQKQP